MHYQKKPPIHLIFGFKPHSKVRLPEADLELGVDEDSIFIYDTVMGTVESRKNEKMSKFKYRGQQFDVKMNVDTIFSIGDFLTWVWVKSK